MVIGNLAFVIGEQRSENFAKNEEFSEIGRMARMWVGTPRRGVQGPKGSASRPCLRILYP
jgi:hypothetical protein